MVIILQITLDNKVYLVANDHDKILSNRRNSKTSLEYREFIKNHLNQSFDMSYLEE